VTIRLKRYASGATRLRRSQTRKSRKTYACNLEGKNENFVNNRERNTFSRYHSRPMDDL
jgi:hypothetical protein